MTELAVNVRCYLSTHAQGFENAMPIKWIAAWCGFPLPLSRTARRSMEKAIEEIRDTGYPLCSTCSTNGGGMYVAQTVAEYMPYYRQIDNRIKKMSNRRSIMLKKLECMSEAEGTPLELVL